MRGDSQQEQPNSAMLLAVITAACTVLLRMAAAHYNVADEEA